MNKRNRPIELTDAPEHRTTPVFEVRADADEITLKGYASTFEPYEMYGGPAMGGWIEQLSPSAFDVTLREKPDLHLLINHEGMPLARTKSGTLKLSVDKHGLLTEARLDRSDPDVQRLEAKMRRGDMDEMSFAFRVKRQEWSAADGFEDDVMSHRTITEVSLHKGDVSVVNFGANPTTHAEIKSIDQALELLAMCAPEELVEARSANGEEIIRRANAALELLARTAKPSQPSETPEPFAAFTATLGAKVEDRSDAEPEDTEPEERNDDTSSGETTETAGRRPMSVMDAYRRMGLAPDDGTTISTADALAQSDSEKSDPEQQ